MSFDDDYFGMAEKIIGKVIRMKTDNGLPILPSTKNVTNQKCYEEACDMLYQIYDGTFFRFNKIVERKDYNMTDWKLKIIACEGNWSEIHSLVIQSVKNFYKSLYPEYAPQNKKYLKTIKFSNFFRTGFNQSMFINCINPPLESQEFLTKCKVESLKNKLCDSDLICAECFFKKYVGESKFASVYWQGVLDIVAWWNLFKKYTDFAFDVKGNFKDGNILSDYLEYIGEYVRDKHVEVKMYWFMIREDESAYICEGMFRRYIMSDRFTVARDLPNQLWYYGCEERFATLVKSSKPKIIKEIKDEDETSFIDNLED